MTFNISQDYEQEQCLASDLVAFEAHADEETRLNHRGEYLGATGFLPEEHLWGNLSYRSGYLTGVGQYYDNKFKTVFDEPF